MTGFTIADHSTSPPRIARPRDYNATADLVEWNLAAGRAGKLAVIDDAGQYTYGALSERVNRAGNALKALGIEPEQRIFLCMTDGIDFASVFLGAIKIGAVPVPVNTLLTAEDYAFMLSDSRARAAVISEALYERVQSALHDQPRLARVAIAGRNVHGQPELAKLMAAASPMLEPAQTTADDPAFWLYSSGSTGQPKGTVHVQSSLVETAELYAKPVLGIAEADVVFSAAKLFFAYGLGNALTFPFRVGATSVLMAERPTPAAVARILRQHRPSIFYGVPTLFAALLASGELPAPAELSLRCCVSAGEALPAGIGERWRAATGVDILDGIGSTEMLHIFLSNSPSALRYGTTGKAVPGYELKLVDDAGQPVKSGEIGELLVSGPTGAAFYWNNRTRSRDTFQGRWTRTGDKYRQCEDGYYVYCGRTDDMLKVGGIYVSPFEIEGELVTHPGVLEAAVIGAADENGLVKAKAFVVAKPGIAVGEAFADELRAHVRARLAPFKYPKWIEFVSDLPKTATGKIQRFRLRQREADRASRAA
ncbi:MAG: benzoate-CoA ligase family protein [Proteobacteria bacterium]|nr:benzoate-CoA ligase family protein [Pseudomonadota bacterium]MBI3496393.1 benzoate-CoA ligase family protein [Pseudomonadota bacterium]